MDSSIYVFRAWHTLPASITDAQGAPANAAFGFAEFLYKLISRRNPGRIVCAFDESLTRSIRHKIYPDYKANRPPAPENLKKQFGHCRKFARAIGLSTFASLSVEADDIIGMLAEAAGKQGLASVIVSADKDLCQFVGPDDAVWDYARDVWLDARLVEKRFGVRPGQIADLLALCGDKVDNIPGVPGVGVATAARLLVKWGNIEMLLNNTGKVASMKFRGAPRISQLLDEHQHTIRLARQLTGLWRDDSIECDCASFTITPDYQALDTIFDELSFNQQRRTKWLDLLKNRPPGDGARTTS
ncbi:hypothetical protein AB833_16985 [Chromatiales bacterium (ex Bugula neritina AB1)]|nr:hypothetical protein AB833_16985 [Chromatiales bacterium (ex Bugula neritina AB1)]